MLRVEDYLEMTYVCEINWLSEKEHANYFVVSQIREWKNANPETPYASSSKFEKSIWYQTDAGILPMWRLQHSRDIDEYNFRLP